MKLKTILNVVNIGTSALAFGLTVVKKENRQPFEYRVEEAFSRVCERNDIQADISFGDPALAATFSPLALAYVLPGKNTVYFPMSEGSLRIMVLLLKLPEHVLLDVVFAHELGHLQDPYIKQAKGDLNKTTAERNAWKIGLEYSNYKSAYHAFNLQNMLPYWGKDLIQKIVNK